MSDHTKAVPISILMWRKGEDNRPIRAYEKEERGEEDLSLLESNSIGGEYRLSTIMLYK